MNIVMFFLYAKTSVRRYCSVPSAVVRTWAIACPQITFKIVCSNHLSTHEGTHSQQSKKCDLWNTNTTRHHLLSFHSTSHVLGEKQYSMLSSLLLESQVTLIAETSPSNQRPLIPINKCKEIQTQDQNGRKVLNGKISCRKVMFLCQKTGKKNFQSVQNHFWNLKLIQHVPYTSLAIQADSLPFLLMRKTLEKCIAEGLTGLTAPQEELVLSVILQR